MVLYRNFRVHHKVFEIIAIVTVTEKTPNCNFFHSWIFLRLFWCTMTIESPHLNSSVQYCRDVAWVSGRAWWWAPMLPRGASLSDGWTSDRGWNSTLVETLFIKHVFGYWSFVIFTWLQPWLHLLCIWCMAATFYYFTIK